MIEAEEMKLANEKKRHELASAYRRLFATGDGKVVLKDLERFCGFLNSSVCEASPDSLQTMYCEGKRRVFLRIRYMLRNQENE